MLQTAASGGGAAAPGVRGPDEWRESVVLCPRKGALPTVYAAAVRTGSQMGFKVGLQAEALLLAH
eukprot:890406-Lingulodinium_polyedra.AAC.1